MNVPNPSKKYHITYSIKAHKDGLTKSEVSKIDDKLETVDHGGVGGCHAIIAFSLIYPPDGSYSWLMVSKDGQTDQELSDNEIFKAWMMLTNRLAESKTLPEGKKRFCSEIVEVFRGILAGTKPDEPRT